MISAIVGLTMIVAGLGMLGKFVQQLAKYDEQRQIESEDQ